MKKSKGKAMQKVMCWLLSAAVLSIGMFVVPFSVYASPVDPGPNLAAWYKLDETSGTTATDSSGNGNNGSLVTGTWQSAGGKFNGAIDLNGTGDGIRLAPNNSSGVGLYYDSFSQRTVSVWFKADTTSGSRILYEQGDNNQGLALRIKDNKLEAAIVSNAIANREVISVDFTDTVNWNRAMVVFDNGNFRLYLNSKLVASTTTVFGSVLATTNGAGLGTAYSNTAAANNAFNEDVSTFQGMLDDVRIYTTAVDGSLAAWYKLDETSGTTAADSSWNGNTATSATGTWSPTGGYAGGAFDFNGVDSGIQLAPYNASGNGIYYDAFTERTVSLYFKADSTSGTRILYEQGNNNNGLAIRLNNGNLQAAVVSGGTASKTVVSTPFSDTVSWNEVKVVFLKGSFKLYLNDSMVSEATSGFTQVQSTSNGAGLGTAYATNDASSNAFNEACSPFDGKIDDVSIYNDAIENALVTVDFQSAEYPALTKKFGINQSWNQYTPNLTSSMDYADQASASVLGTLIDYRDVDGTDPSMIIPRPSDTQSVQMPDPLIYKDQSDGTIKVNVNQNLLNMETTTRNKNLPLNLFQFAGVPRNSMAAWYKLDEASGTTTADSSGNLNTGTQVSGTWLPSGGETGGALQLNGGTDGVRLAPNSSTGTGLYYDAFNERVVDFWFKASQTTGTMMLYEQGGNNAGLAVRIKDGSLEAAVVSGGTANKYTISTPFTDTVNWNFVMVDFKQGSFKLYLNGTLMAQTTTSFQQVAKATNGAGLGTAFGNTTATSNAFNEACTSFVGLIDDVRIYKAYDWVIPIDPTLVRSSGANWYPLPASADIQTLADAYVSLAKAIDQQDGLDLPPWWCFWQEPNHTLGDNLTDSQALDRYLDFFKRVGSGLRQVNRDYTILGIQQNSANGRNANGVIDGDEYKVFSDKWLSLEAQDQTKYPLDYFTIQNYSAEYSKDIINNTRVALGNSRFNKTPVFINKFGYNKDNGLVGDADKWNTPDTVMTLMDILKYDIDQPDVAYVVLPRIVFDYDTSNALAYYPVQFIGSMPEMRRTVGFDGAGSSFVRGLASGDDEAETVLLWNSDTKDIKLDVSLKNLSTVLVNGSQNLVVKTMSNSAPAVERTVDVSTTNVALQDINIPSKGFVMISLGSPSRDTTRVNRSKYVKHESWVPRKGISDYSQPSGMGHYETLNESLVAAVKDSTGVGLSGVVYKGIPTTGYTLLADMVSSGLPASNSNTVLGLRVDYLDGDNSMKTVFYRDSRYTGADPWSALNDWLPTNSPSIIQSDFNSQIAMDISGNAPAGWTTADNGARRMQVSLILQGVSGKAEAEARLTD